MRTNRANTGKAFEDQVKACLTAYSAKGLLRCCKVEPATRIVGGGFNRKVIFLHNDWADFAGVWTENGGRMVVIEAKSTSRPRLALGTGGITDTQIQSMASWHGAGAVVFALWEYRGQCRLITMPDITQALKIDKAKSLTWGPSTGQLVPIGMGYVLFDFLSVMRKLWMPACKLAFKPLPGECVGMCARQQ
jgi:penicillin-binding protein-related factor A (putative recombinase)